MAGLQTALAPGFLVAAPSLPDPNFVRTLIFLMEHTEGGAMGLVVHRSLKLPLGRLLQEVGLENTAGFTEPVLYGGPVSPSRGWVVHESGWTIEGSLVVAEGIALSSTREVLEAIAEGGGPLRYHVCLGYSRWGPFQLEQEIAIGSWVPVPFSAELIFDTPLALRWERALRDNGIDPAMVVSRRVEA